MVNQTQIAMDDVGNELQQLNQTQPIKRGDVAAGLQVIAARIHDLDVALTSLRGAKNQAEETRRKLAEQEGDAKRVLDASTSADLRPAFDKEVVSNIRKLIDRFVELRSVDLWVIGGRQEDIAGATRSLEELQRRISDARAKYDLAMRQSGEIANYQQSLADIKALIQREGLGNFLVNQTQIAMDDVGNELQQLNQTQPIKRGDKAADLEVIKVRIRDMETSITSAQAAKRAKLNRPGVHS